jgi:hypothetical protein
MGGEATNRMGIANGSGGGIRFGTRQAMNRWAKITEKGERKKERS